MAKKLYTTLPRTFSCRLVDNLGMVLYPIKPFIFYPNKPVEVSDDIAEKLMAQYPDQLSVLPYDELTDDQKYTDTPPGLPSGFYRQAAKPSEKPVELVTDGSLKPKAKKAGKLTEVIPPIEPPAKAETVKPPDAPKNVDLIPILEEINTKGIDSLTPQEIREYGKKLGKIIPANIKKDKQREMLDKACDEIYTEYEKSLAAK